MPKRKDRIIIDTNLWISFLLSGSLSRLDKLFQSDSIELVFCDELLQEFIEVVRRPKFRKTISDEDIKSLLGVIAQKAIFVDLHSNIKMSRDIKDDFLLSLAKDSKATHLLTGDKDLLILKRIGTTSIQTYSSYISER